MSEMKPTKEIIIELLKQVIDPELMVNIVDLGLVYDIKIQDDKKVIQVEMTLTSAGCPLGDMILADVECVLKEQVEGYSIMVYLVWDPVWSPDLLTQAGKSALERF